MNQGVEFSTPFNLTFSVLNAIITQHFKEKEDVLGKNSAGAGKACFSA
jgi:hypothetical protein